MALKTHNIYSIYIYILRVCAKYKNHMCVCVCAYPLWVQICTQKWPKPMEIFNAFLFFVIDNLINIFMSHWHFYGKVNLIIYNEFVQVVCTCVCVCVLERRELKLLSRCTRTHSTMRPQFASFLPSAHCPIFTPSLPSYPPQLFPPHTQALPAIHTRLLCCFKGL